MKTKIILRSVLPALFAALLCVQAQTVVTTYIDEDDGTALPAIGNGTSLREAVTHAATDYTCRSKPC